jgi:hypothetical protein
VDVCAARRKTRGAQLTRREFLTTSAAVLAVARDGVAREHVSREIFLRSPGKGTAVSACAYYTQCSGGAMVSVEGRSSRSDTTDAVYCRKSADYGHTWSEPTERKIREKRPEGTWRLAPRAGYVDPHTGRYLEFWNEAVLPTDNPLEGLRQWNVFYSVEGVAHQVIHEGPEFDPRHPLPGVFTGKNCVMLGDVPCLPITLKDGSILLPVQITPLDASGKLYNPGGGYTYTDVAILHAHWKGNSLQWQMAELIKGDPARSTRGMDEGTLGALADGRLIVVMRGSNHRKPQLPGYRWISYSHDGGWHWTAPAPWTYSSGEPFYSPSSCSQLLRHSNGRLYWLGNICRENPNNDLPRRPFYVGEVDQHTGLLIRKSLIVVDDVEPGDDPILMLSNFYAREDRETRQIALHMTRMFALKDGWVGDAYLYRVDV